MKKALSWLLALIMIFSMIPVAAFADGEPTISFETTFADDMTVGATFTVTGSLDNNPGMATMTLSLKWNEEAVKFTGFEAYEDGYPVSEVFEARGWSVETNHNEGIVIAARTANNSTNGTLFTANFEIIGSGELGIGLKDADRTEFEMVNAAMEVIEPVIDYSAISGLSVAALEPEGPAIPAGAPFTAISTDKGAVTGIEYIEDIEPAYGDPIPYYRISIPEGANEVYVTDRNQLVMEVMDYVTGQSQGKKATAYLVDIEDNWNMVTANYEFEQLSDAVKIIIPMEMTVQDMGSNSEIEAYFPADENGEVSYGFAGEKADYSATYVLTFSYSEGGEDAPTTYRINIAENITGGAVSAVNADGETITEAAAGDIVFLNLEPDDDYKVQYFSVTDANGLIGADNGFFQMPEGDVTITATFTPIHSCSYTESVVNTEYLKSEATCKTGAVYYKSCECGKFDNSETAVTFVSGDPNPDNHSYVEGSCQWCGKEEPSGYFFAASADVSAENGGTAVVHVKITGHSDENITGYNAYDVTLTFDSEKLELATDEEGNYIYSGAVKSDNGSVTVSGNTIRIVGCGDNKEFDTEIAVLTFKTKAEGNANVTISKVQVSDKKESVKEDAPEATPKHDENDTTADTTPDQSVVQVPYTVNKPDFISGNPTVLPGKDYTFSFTGTENYEYTGLTVKVGGVAVEGLTPDENGVYTIENVTGAIEIAATRTGKTYSVTVENGGAAVDAPATATYGEVYSFTVAAADGKDIDTVKVTKTADATSEISYTINESGAYVIEGTAITADFTITVTQKDAVVPETKYTNIIFSGITAEEIEGGQLTQKVEADKDFTFKLIETEGVTYTVKIGEEVLTANEDGSYTIPAAKMIEGNLTVTIQKAENINVDVMEYIKLDGQSMFLVTAKSAATDSVLKYGEKTMYRSSKYGAYSWLVISEESAEDVKDAAEAAITIVEADVTAVEIAYNYDVNGTSKVDVNDAQLAYDMYNAAYNAFTENLTMKKFLEADLDGSKNLGTQDVAVIISFIVNGAAN